MKTLITLIALVFLVGCDRTAFIGRCALSPEAQAIYQEAWMGTLDIECTGRLVTVQSKYTTYDTMDTYLRSIVEHGANTRLDGIWVRTVQYDCTTSPTDKITCVDNWYREYSPETDTHKRFP